MANKHELQLIKSLIESTNVKNENEMLPVFKDMQFSGHAVNMIYDINIDTLLEKGLYKLCDYLISTGLDIEDELFYEVDKSSTILTTPIERQIILGNKNAFEYLLGKGADYFKNGQVLNTALLSYINDIDTIHYNYNEKLEDKMLTKGEMIASLTNIARQDFNTKHLDEKNYASMKSKLHRLHTDKISFDYSERFLKPFTEYVDAHNQFFEKTL